MPNTFVFVYGTLKNGFYNHSLMQDSKFIGNGLLENHAMYEYHFPVITPDKSHDVRGEIYIVTGETLENLDVIESNGYMYLRKHMNVYSDKFATNIKCHVYIGSPKFWDFTQMDKVSSNRIHEWI